MTPYRILLSPEAGAEGSPAGDAEAGPGPLRAAAAAEAEERLRQAERRFDEERARLSSQAERWERAYKAALREKELATVLAGRPLVPGAAAQLVKLWREDLEVIDEAGGLRVASKDGRPIAEAVASWLAGPDYAHFSRPGSRGGTAPPGDSRSAATAPASPPPRTLGEAVLDRWREAARASRDDPTAPIGLGRRRP